MTLSKYHNCDVELEYIRIDDPRIQNLDAMLQRFRSIVYSLNKSPRIREPNNAVQRFRNSQIYRFEDSIIPETQGSQKIQSIQAVESP